MSGGVKIEVPAFDVVAIAVPGEEVGHGLLQLLGACRLFPTRILMMTAGEQAVEIVSQVALSGADGRWIAVQYQQTSGKR